MPHTFDNVQQLIPSEMSVQETVSTAGGLAKDEFKQEGVATPEIVELDFL